MSDEELPEELTRDIQLIDDYSFNREELMTQTERSQRLKQALERTADALRNARLRLAAGQALFVKPCSLTDTLTKCAMKVPLHEGYAECCAQVGRVVANLVADCDANRDLVAGTDYIDKVNFFLRLVPARVEVKKYPFAIVRPVIASLLNLVVEEHGPSIEGVAQWPILGALLHTAMQVARSENVDEASSLVDWICDICSKVVEKSSGSLAKVMVGTDWIVLSLPLRDFTSEYRQSRVGIKVLGLAASMMELLASHDDIVLSGLEEIERGISSIKRLTQFVELGNLPNEWTGDPTENEDLSLDNCQKGMSDAKEAVIRTIVDLAAHEALLEPPFDSFWVIMRSWLQSDRSDLLMCTLLSFGNSSREDARATELVQGPKSILDNTVPLLDPSTDVKVQHALIGLLRNLSIPSTNKADLGNAGVIEKIIDMRPWSEDRDLVGSVQGGAIGLIKNLCRDNVENSQRFIGNDAGLESLLALMKRTDDQAIRFEATRIFVNVIKSMSKAQNRDSLLRVESEDVVGYLCEMIRIGGQMPVLINEGVIAVTLLVSFGEAETVSLVAEHLTTIIAAPGDGAASALEVLRSVTAVTDEATKGIRENCKVLRGVLLEKLREDATGRDEIEALTT